MGRLLLALSAAALLTTFPAAVAQAAVFTVDTTVDAANVNPMGTTCATAARTCSLRAAITAANNLAGVDTVALRAGTYTLAGALGGLRVTRSLTINGVDTRATIIDGGGRVTPLSFTTSGTSYLHGVTLTGTGGGTGLYVDGQHLIAERIAVRDNVGTGPGAGIWIQNGDVTLTRSAVTGNRIVTNGQAQGGGIYLAAATSLVADTVTIANNSATANGMPAFGAGLLTNGAVELRHATVWGNSLAGNSTVGSSFYINGTGSLRLADSVLGGGSGSSTQCGGATPPARTGINIGGGTGCGFTSADPRLAPLADAGGPTDVLVPAWDSPAIGAAAACFEGGVDQREQAAPSGAACDVGAAELGADLVTSATALTPTVDEGGTASILVTVADAGLDTAVGTAVDIAVANGTVVSAQAVGGGTCTVGATVSCELGTIGRGAERGVALAVKATTQTAIGVTATASSLVADPNPADATASVAVPVQVLAGPTPPIPQPPTPGPSQPPGGSDQPRAPTARAPELTAVKVAGRPRAGRAFKVNATLSRDATVTVKIDRSVRGRKSGRGRRATCRAGVRRGRACTAHKPAGTVTVAGLRAGRISLTVPARLKRKRLAKGAYRLTLTARSADGLTSRAVVLRSVRLR